MTEGGVGVVTHKKKLTIQLSLMLLSNCNIEHNRQKYVTITVTMYIGSSGLVELHRQTSTIGNIFTINSDEIYTPDWPK